MENFRNSSTNTNQANFSTNTSNHNNKRGSNYKNQKRNNSNNNSNNKFNNNRNNNNKNNNKNRANNNFNQNSNSNQNNSNQNLNTSPNSQSKYQKSVSFDQFNSAEFVNTSPNRKFTPTLGNNINISNTSPNRRYNHNKSPHNGQVRRSPSHQYYGNTYSNVDTINSENSEFVIERLNKSLTKDTINNSFNELVTDLPSSMSLDNFQLRQSPSKMTNSYSFAHSESSTSTASELTASTTCSSVAINTTAAQITQAIMENVANLNRSTETLCEPPSNSKSEQDHEQSLIFSTPMTNFEESHQQQQLESNLSTAANSNEELHRNLSGPIGYTTASSTTSSISSPERHETSIESQALVTASEGEYSFGTTTENNSHVENTIQECTLEHEPNENVVNSHDLNVQCELIKDYFKEKALKHAHTDSTIENIPRLEQTTEMLIEHETQLNEELKVDESCVNSQVKESSLASLNQNEKQSLQFVDVNLDNESNQEFVAEQAQEVQNEAHETDVTNETSMLNLTTKQSEVLELINDVIKNEESRIHKHQELDTNMDEQIDPKIIEDISILTSQNYSKFEEEEVQNLINGIVSDVIIQATQSNKPNNLNESLLRETLEEISLKEELASSVEEMRKNAASRLIKNATELEMMSEESEKQEWVQDPLRTHTDHANSEILDESNEIKAQPNETKNLSDNNTTTLDKTTISKKNNTSIGGKEPPVDCFSCSIL